MLLHTISTWSHTEGEWGSGGWSRCTSHSAVMSLLNKLAAAAKPEVALNVQNYLGSAWAPAFSWRHSRIITRACCHFPQEMMGERKFSLNLCPTLLHHHHILITYQGVECSHGHFFTNVAKITYHTNNYLKEYDTLNSGLQTWTYNAHHFKF